MKKLTTFITSLLLLIPTTAVYAATEDDLKTFSESSNSVAILYNDTTQKDTTTKDVKKDDVITYTYAFSKLEGVTSLLTNCTYDNTAFDFVKAEYSKPASQEGMNKVDTNGESSSNSKQSVVSEGFTVTDNSATVSGGYCKISFKAKSDTSINNKTFTFTVKASANDKEIELTQYEFNESDYVKYTGKDDVLGSSDIKLAKDTSTNDNQNQDQTDNNNTDEPGSNVTDGTDDAVHVDVTEPVDTNANTDNQTDIATATADSSNPGKGDWKAQKTADNSFQLLIGAIAGILIFVTILATVGVKNKDKIAKLLKFKHHSL